MVCMKIFVRFPMKFYTFYIIDLMFSVQYTINEIFFRSVNNRILLKELRIYDIESLRERETH